VKLIYTLEKSVKCCLGSCSFVCVGCTKVNFLETKNRHGAAGSTAPSTNEKYTRDPLLLDYLFQTPPTLSYESADPLFFTHKETFGHLRIPTFQLFYSPLYSIFQQEIMPIYSFRHFWFHILSNSILITLRINRNKEKQAQNGGDCQRVSLSVGGQPTHYPTFTQPILTTFLLHVAS
jgi:hypothetical protein